MAVTQADIDNLNAALRSGERRVRFADGKEVEYRSVDDLLKARNDAQSELNAASGVQRQTRLYHGGRGFC